MFKNYLFNKWRTIAKSYGYEEYDTSVLENESLYTIKSGDEIGEQLFNFVDKANRRVTLRPEMTPSLARMIISKHASNQLTLPIKWYSLPQCWRYEKTTRGRRRFVGTQKLLDFRYIVIRIILIYIESITNGIWTYGE